MPKPYMRLFMPQEGHLMRTGRARLVETLQDMLLQSEMGDDDSSYIGMDYASAIAKHLPLAESFAASIIDDIRLGIISGEESNV